MKLFGRKSENAIGEATPLTVKEPGPVVPLYALSCRTIVCYCFFRTGLSALYMPFGAVRGYVFKDALKMSVGTIAMSEHLSSNHLDIACLPVLQRL